MQKEFQKRVLKYLDEQAGILKKNKVAVAPTINFPDKKKIPILSRFALWIITKQGGIFDTRFFDLKK